MFCILIDGKFFHILQGNKSSQDEKGTSALKAVEIDDRLGGAAVQVMNSFKLPQLFTQNIGPP